MTDNFYSNNVFEENLNIGWNISDGIFTTSGQVYVLQHLPAIQNIKELTSISIVKDNIDQFNDFNVQYRWSTDNVTFTPYIDLNDLNDFPNANTNPNIWLQFKFTYFSNGLKQANLKEININGLRTIPEIFQPIPILPGENKSYTNQDTYKVFTITDFDIYLSSGDINNLKIFYRYTQTQGRHWTEWTALTADNLKASKFERLKFCNFQFGFQNIGIEPISIYDLELIGEFQNITANYATTARLGFKSQCNPLAVKPAPCSGADVDGACCDACLPCSQALTPWNSDIENCSVCSFNNITNLNDKVLFKNQINTYEILNSFIEKKNSWTVKYFLTDADRKGIDHILHEQQIHNIIVMKDTSVIVPDNQFPTENMMFSGLDLDLIQSFEIHILKESFKRTFGVEFRPSKEDVIYFCDINQLWEIEQMFPSRGFMNAEVYYRVLLKKYNDKATRKAAKTVSGQEAGDFINAITKYTTLDNLFNIDEDSDIKQNTKDNAILGINNTSQQYTDTPLLNIVKTVHNTVSFKNEIIWNASLNVSKQNYEMPIKSKNLHLIEYNYNDNILGKADNRAISFWFKTEDYNPTYDYTIFSNYNYTDNLGYRVNIFDGLLTITINSNSYSLPIGSLNINKWYSMLINVDQIKQKLELAVYSRQDENGIVLTSSQLVLFGKKEYDIIPNSFTINETMFIGGCDTFSTQGNSKKWFITNLIIWNQPVAKAKRNIVLNQDVISDAHLTILVDDASQVLDLPNYGNI